MKKTFYEFLGVAPDASQEEIEAVSKYLAKRFHPSKYPSNKRIVLHFNRLKRVYNTLANPHKRQAYDDALAKITSNSKPQTATNNSRLWRGEKIIYSAKIHWVGYLKALIIVSIASYFLWIEPTMLKNYVAAFDFLQAQLQYIKPGLFAMLGLGVLMLLQTLRYQVITKLSLTSQRIMAEFGLFTKQQVAITNNRFENIAVTQGIFGKILGFGTIKIKGQKSSKVTGDININLQNVAAPKKFEQHLLQLLK